jgi:multiple sugar transport system permease protein
MRAPTILGREVPLDAGRSLAGLLLVAPALLMVLFFFLIPLAMTAWMSLHDWPLMGQAEFIGWDNYVRILEDTRFLRALGFTLWYSLWATVAIFALAFPLALFVDQPGPATAVYRTALFLPVVVGFASASLLWAWLINVDSGLLSPALLGLGLIDEPLNVLRDTDQVFVAVLILVVWKTVGFSMILLLTGIQSVPQDLHEAAILDGASRWQRFTRITLPLIRRTLALALILSITGSMLAFDQFYIISGGGPRNSTVTAVYWIFSQSFVSFKLGYGAALSMILMVILAVVALIQMRLLRSPENRA